MQKNRRAFFVRSTTRIDRPELRGPTFYPVVPGTRCQNLDRFSTAKAARERMAALLAGIDDSAGEYISSVDAYSVEVRVSLNEYGREVVTEIGRRHYLCSMQIRERADSAEHVTA